MREQIEERLSALRQEFEAGRRMLADLEARQVELQQTLLRIGGAVQVLEELLGAGEPAAGAAPDAGAPGTGAPGAGVPGAPDEGPGANGRAPVGAAAGGS